MAVKRLLLLAALCLVARANTLIYVLPDPQNVAAVNWNVLCNYIIANPPAMVVVVGDWTNYDGATPDLWTRVTDCTARLATAGIPIIGVPGNHDYPSGSFRNPAYYISQVVGSSITSDVHFCGQMTYDASTLANYCWDVTIEGRPWRFLLLEYWPRTQVVNWALTKMRAAPGASVTLVTHGFLTNLGVRTSAALDATNWGPGVYSLSSANCVTGYETNCGLNADEIWNLVKGEPNLRLILNGHQPQTPYYSSATFAGDKGNSVVSVRSDFQDENLGVVTRLLYKTSGTCGAVAAPCLSVTHRNIDGAAEYDGTDGHADLRGDIALPVMPGLWPPGRPLTRW